MLIKRIVKLLPTLTDREEGRRGFEKKKKNTKKNLILFPRQG